MHFSKNCFFIVKNVVFFGLLAVAKQKKNKIKINDKFKTSKFLNQPASIQSWRFSLTEGISGGTITERKQVLLATARPPNFVGIFKVATCFVR